MRLRPLVLCILAIAMFALPIRAQKGGGSGGSRGTPSGGSGRPFPPPIQPVAQPNPELTVDLPTPDSAQKPIIVEDEACFPWDLSQVRGATVSTINLEVPAKARSLYEKACGAFKKKKFSEAEQHARDAIQKYSNYSAAWVMLGQALQDEQKMDEAHEACSHPMSVDPTYLPPYLCLAGLLLTEKKWDDLLALSDRFLGVNPSGDLYANYYRGLSLFFLDKLAEAQKNILAAIAIDGAHHQPALFFLLAQTYGEQGDVADAAAQIQQFMKYSSSKKDKDEAAEYLSELQSQQKTK